MRILEWRPTALRLWRLTAIVEGVVHAQVRPPMEGRTAVVGDDPIRILLVGAGTAVGYGVQSRSDALDGRLATALAEATGRGVVVETRLRRELRLRETVDVLGASGAHTFDAVVWSPTFKEVTRLLPTTVWTVALNRIVAHLRTTGTARTRVILLGLPEVITSIPDAVVGMRRLRRVNDRIAAAAAHADGITFMPVPAIGPVVDGGAALWDRDYYTRCAELLVTEMAGALAVPTRVGR